MMSETNSFFFKHQLIANKHKKGNTSLHYICGCYLKFKLAFQFSFIYEKKNNTIFCFIKEKLRMLRCPFESIGERET